MRRLDSGGCDSIMEQFEKTKSLRVEICLKFGPNQRYTDSLLLSHLVLNEGVFR